MKISVNEKTIDLLPGMKVRHALTRAGFSIERDSTMKAYDQWGNEIGLDGALAEGMTIEVRADEDASRQEQ